MRKLTADFILGPEGKLLSGYILVISETGKIIDLTEDVTDEVEYYPGILSPGFINTHCHLELSHFKNKIARATGLNGFVEEFVRLRRSENSDATSAIEKADNVMWENGIQAVGDISNNDSTFFIKSKSKIRYHSFVEIFNMASAEAELTFKKGIELMQDARKSHRCASLVPHAPYSSSPKLFELIKQSYEGNPYHWSIHNQESEAENEMFIDGTGRLIEMFKNKGIDMSWFVPSGRSSLKSTSRFFPSHSNLLLVHNTFTTQEDINFLKENNFVNKTWFSICAKANMFIEQTLPNLNMLIRNNCNITIGTDSLASNDTLSVLEELKVIANAFPKIKTEALLTFATRNGAHYFGWNDLGVFQKNTTPGIINITNADKYVIRDDSVAIRLM